jgi:hypothetical protein
MKNHVRAGRDGVIRAVFFRGTRTPEATAYETDYAEDFGWRRARAGVLWRVEPWQVVVCGFTRPYDVQIEYSMGRRIEDVIKANIPRFENVIVANGFQL